MQNNHLGEDDWHVSRDSIEDYYATYRSNLKRTFLLLFEQVSALGFDEFMATAIAHRLTLASEHQYLPATLIRLAASRSELPEFTRLLYALSRIRTSFGAILLEAYQTLRFSIRDTGETFIEEVSDQFTRLDNPDQALRFCVRSASSEQCMVFLRLFGSMAGFAAQSVPAFFALLEKVRNICSWSTIRDWIARGVDLISSGRTEEGVSYLLGLSRESRELLGMRFAVLSDKKNVLHIYTTSFGGRVFGIHELEISIFGVQQPYTDGVSIFLPDTIDIFSSIEANESVYAVLASVQASFVQHGTYDFNESRIDYAADLQRRYGTLLPSMMDEVEKRFGTSARTVRERATGEIGVVFGNDRVLTVLETPHEEHFFRYPTPDLYRELFVSIERARVEAQIGRSYPGYSEDIAEVNRGILASLPDIPSGNVDYSAELEFVLSWVLRLSLGDTYTPGESHDRIDRILASAMDAFELVRRDDVDVHISGRLGFEIYNLLFDAYPVVTWCTENDVRTLFAHRCIATIVPEIVGEVTPDLITGRKERPVFESEEEAEEEDVDLTSLSKSERKAHDLRLAILNGNIHIYQYPEYDLHRGGYAQKHCTVYESVLDSGSPDVYTQALETHQQIYKKLRKRFLIMQPDAVSVQRKWLVGDEIHISDATDYVTDLLRGSSPDEKIYIRRNRNDRSIAAAVLVDVSSSTEEMLNGARIIDTERTAISLLASALSIVGDAFAIYTFFSMGRRNVFLSVVKEFNESWTEETWSRIDSIDANASNRDGCAIRHTTFKLMQQEERTKLLILLSDGIPADTGYGSGGSSETNAYAIEDTRRAIIEARIAGITPYCITIDRNARDYTPHLYGEYHYTVLPDVSSLPEKLSNLYLKLTK